ncbi:MAG: hypothetical protein R3A52_07340 [Polyangiales bacterium]
MSAGLMRALALTLTCALTAACGAQVVRGGRDASTDATPDVDVVPRGASRAALVALSASLALGACHSRGPTESQPLIVAPYGAPPPPPRDVPPAVGSLTWHLTISSPIPMSARAATPLQISATNDTSAPLRPERHRLRLLVNGQPSPVFDLAFNNGVTGPEWETLPPGQTARDSRTLVESLFTAPGEYMLTLEWDGHAVDRRSVTVEPSPASPLVGASSLAFRPGAAPPSRGVNGAHGSTRWAVTVAGSAAASPALSSLMEQATALHITMSLGEARCSPAVGDAYPPSLDASDAMVATVVFDSERAARAFAAAMTEAPLRVGRVRVMCAD